MAAFTSTTELFNYFRVLAQKFNCNPCLDSKIAEIEAMNSKGKMGTPRCLCKVNTSCPCPEAENEIERDGSCYCEIFRRI